MPSPEGERRIAEAEAVVQEKIHSTATTYRAETNVSLPGDCHATACAYARNDNVGVR